MKVGIIGGGIAGLTAAWLLDGECEVTLFEKNSTLGGHARTVYVEIGENKIPIEIGFEFFNKAMYPHLWKLLSLLSVQTRDYPFTSTFFSPHSHNALVLPPSRNVSLFLKSLFSKDLITLLQFKYLTHKAIKVVRHEQDWVDLDQFLNENWFTDSFKYNFFLPFMCAGWGVPPTEFKTFSAYNILSWLIDNKPMALQPTYWTEMVGGVSSYIQSLQDDIKHAKFNTSTEVTQLVYDGTKYHIIDAQGNACLVDEVIIATNAFQAINILKNIDHAKDVMSILSTIEYIQAFLAVHSDLRFLPKKRADWSVSNIMYDGTFSTLTIYKKWKYQVPFLRSWLLPTFEKPHDIIALEEYYHAKPTPAYFNVQNLLKPLQGKNNLWFAGIYTMGIDSHESALASAIPIVCALKPDAQRLKLLL